MSVLLETSLGDLVLDLEVAAAPRACTSFLKLCQVKYFNDCTFAELQRHFTITGGDPTVQPHGRLNEQPDLTGRIAASGAGGDSIQGLLYGSQARFFAPETSAALGHSKRGTVSMLPIAGSPGGIMHGSTFFITLADGLEYLDGKGHTVFAHVVEGLDEFIAKLETVATDEKNRPKQNIKIRHTIVLEDPFPNAPALAELVPPQSPKPLLHSFDFEVLAAEEVLEAERRATMTTDELAKEEQAKDARQHAIVLEMLGDLPDADLKPPEDILFVCKLNPLTRSEDLELIFSQCGPVSACDVITDWKTGASLQYAFIEFEKREDAERAYLKLNNVLIDERRIKVDFSQSVSKQWNNFRREKAKKKLAAAAPKPSVAAPPAPAQPPASRWGSSPASAAQVPAPSSATPSSAVAPASTAASGDPSSSHRHSSSRRSHSRSPRRSDRDDRDRRRSRSRDRDSHRSHRRDDSRRDRSRSRSRSRSRRERSRSTDRDRRSHHSSSSHRTDSISGGGTSNSKHQDSRRSRSPRRRSHERSSRR